MIKIDGLKKRIDVIATTISGSMSDWKKMDRMGAEFEKYYSGHSNVHFVDSHAEAREKTREAIAKGGRIIVSAGGAGTFNSVLEGCYAAGRIPRELRLAFLRKGSADLIGKALKIPDELSSAVQIISQSIEKDVSIPADVIEVEGTSPDDTQWKRHFIGFAGVGVFGDIPYFTENRFTKYYKGILGHFLGDRGPFIVGANLAQLKHLIDGLLHKRRSFKLVADYLEITPENYNSIIILNGDLGKDFPLARGIPLGSGYFRTVTLRELGFLIAYRQLVHCWKGDIFNYSDKLGVGSIKIEKELKIMAENTQQYMVNLDGLLMWAKGVTRYRITDQVRLITG